MSRASRVLSLLAVAALASALTALYFDNKQRTHVEPSDHVVVEHAPAPPLREVRIGYFKNLWLTSVYGGIVSAMDEVGSEFAKVGIHAIFVPFDSSVELAKALVKGDVDMASQTVDQFVTLLHEHPELKAAPVLLTSRTDRNVALIVGKGRHAKLTGKYIATTLAGRSYAQSAVTLAGLQVKVSTARVRGTCELVDPEAPVAEHLREDFVTPHQLTVFQDECKAAPDFAAIALLGDEIKTAMADGDERYEPKAKIKLSGMLVARTGPGSLTKQQLIDFSSAFLKGVNRLANIEHDSAAIKALQTVFDGVSGQGFAEALSLVDIAGKCENEPFAGLRPSSTWQTYLEACEEACDLFDLDPKSCKEEDQTALAERLRSIDVPCATLLAANEHVTLTQATKQSKLSRWCSSTRTRARCETVI